MKPPGGAGVRDLAVRKWRRRAVRITEARDREKSAGLIARCEAVTMPRMDQEQITLAVLAGGLGTRMGGPKSRLTLGGRAILDDLFERFAWRGPTVLVTSPGNQRPPGWERFGAEVTDAAAGEGPLRGVLTALEHAGTAAVAVVTVDMPGIGAAELEWVVGKLEGLAVMCSRDVNGRERVEPFPLAIRASAREVIARRLGAGNRSVYALREEAGVDVVPAPAGWPARVWTNLNRPEDLAAFERG